MKNIHLTEEQIQQYALDAQSCSGAITAHIQQCEHCQQQVIYYKVLIEGIETQEKAVFDFDIADLVMEQLPQPKPTYDKSFSYALVAMIVMMAGLVVYVLGNSLVSLFALVQPILIGLVIITALGLMAFLGVDMYQKYKAQMRTLSLY